MKKKILIFGSGVIGSIMALMFAKSGQEVFMYARGTRLKELNEKGLVYQKNNEIKKAHVHIVSNITNHQIYDFIFVTVRYEQIESALEEIKNIQCGNIVTMVNNPNGYEKWENIVGKNRIIPAFPGAGGKIENGVLDYKITPRFIQSTIFGELNGTKSERIEILKKIFKKARIPHSTSNEMEYWQKCHLALVLPLAQGIYKDGGDNYSTSKNKDAIRYISSSLKSNFSKLKSLGINITPKRFLLLMYIPNPLLMYFLMLIYNTKFAETVICEHALNAREEMMKLEESFNRIINK